MFVIDILKITAGLFIDMAPYLLFGLLVAGLLNLFISRDIVIRHAGKNNFMSVFKAALFGVPLPLCSCGVIPAAIYLKKNGASPGAITSFLISTPTTGIDSILATYGMMGWLFAIFRPFAAFVMGIAGGMTAKLISSGINREEPNNAESRIQDSPAETPKGAYAKFRSLLRYSLVEFMDDISAQFLVGLLIAGLITYLIPDGFFSGSNLLNGIGGMVIMVLVGIPMYICATASIPIAVSLILKGFSPGVVFVFLEAGPATNAATLAIITRLLGRRMAIAYTTVIAVFSILMGLLLDLIFSLSGINPAMQIRQMQAGGEFLNDEIKIITGIIFFALILLSLYRKFLKKRFLKPPAVHTGAETEGRLELTISGMDCRHCAETVCNAIKSTPGEKSVEVSLEKNTAFINGDYNIVEIRSAVEKAGYRVL